MPIKKIKISNFKSFKNLELELGNFNVLVGANASGKSNFLQIFRFIKDITNHGLENALSMQGGIEYLRNINIGSTNDFMLELIFTPLGHFHKLIIKENYNIFISLDETIYSFIIKFKKNKLEPFTIEQKLKYKCEFKKSEKNTNEKKGRGEIVFSNINEKFKFDLNNYGNLKIHKNDLIPKDIIKDIERIFTPKLPLFKLPYIDALLLENLKNIINDISIYDFDPKLPKKAVPITGKVDLEEDGSNLAIVLKNIIEDKEKRRRFSNLIKDLLPFVDNVDVEKFADKSLLFKLREIYFKKKYIPSSLISDGTINIIALIIALYFERKPLTIIEEPERNIHPYLISKVVEMMKDASRNKQIIVTTHNPEIVRYADLENILLISRNKDGFSTITRPYEKKEIKTFLKNDMGIEELYIDNLLEM